MEIGGNGNSRQKFTQRFRCSRHQVKRAFQHRKEQQWGKFHFQLESGFACVKAVLSSEVYFSLAEHLPRTIIDGKKLT